MLNLFIVWALTGLWHGAHWNFVLWGLYFFVFILIERLFLKRLFAKLHILPHIYLLFVVFVGWILFHFTDVRLGWTVFLGLFGERLNKVYALAAGLLLLGAASVLTGLIPDIAPRAAAYAYMLAFSLAGGVGYISVDLLTNSLIADVFRAGKNRVLPYAHAFYGGGAMLAPVFVTALVSPCLLYTSPSPRD